MNALYIHAHIQTNYNIYAFLDAFTIVSLNKNIYLYVHIYAPLKLCQV